MNPVALLDPQLRGVPDVDALLSAGRQHGQNGNLIDQLRDQCSGQAPAAQVGRADSKVAGQLPVERVFLDDVDGGAHPDQNVHQGPASRVQPHPRDQCFRVRQQQSGCDEEGGRGEVTGNGTRLRQGLLTPSNLQCPPGYLQADAELSKGYFGMIAAGQRFNHAGRSGGVESGQQDGRLHLGAGHGHGVIDGLEVSAPDGEGRRVVRACLDFGPHLGQGIDDAPHGAPPQGRVS